MSVWAGTSLGVGLRHRSIRRGEATMSARYKLCRFCGQPMKPKGVKKKPNEYDHASGCPYAKEKR